MKIRITPAYNKKIHFADVWPWIAILAVIIAAGFIRFRLLSVPLERDEGEYAYIAQQMLKGVPPYISAYSMKLPGIYIIYAVLMTIFGQTVSGIHFGLLIVNAATIVVLFLLTRKIFGVTEAVIAGSIFAILSLSSQVLGLWANTEHFVILPALIGLLLIYTIDDKLSYIRIFFAGIILGISFIIKQPGIFFILFAALYLLITVISKKPVKWRKLFFLQTLFLSAALIPFIMVCLFFWSHNIFDKFWFWTFIYPAKYTSFLTLSQAWYLFFTRITAILKGGYPIWFLAVIGLLGVVILKKYRKQSVFTICLLIFSFLAVCPGLYFREHYFIFLLPVVSVLGGLGISLIDDLIKKLNIQMHAIFTAIIVLIALGYSVYDQKFLLFNNPEQISRMIYGVNPFPESAHIAEFIRNNSNPDDTIAILGSEPQILFYSERRSATSYIYMYPLMELHPYARNMQLEMISQIEYAKPRYIMVVNIPFSWLKRPNSENEIFKWFEVYIDNSYDKVGVIDIISGDRTLYYWNNQAADILAQSQYYIIIFKRRV